MDTTSAALRGLPSAPGSANAGTTLGGTATSGAPADADAVQRFDQVLHGTAPTASESAAPAVSPVGGPRTLGDTILGGLKHLSHDLQANFSGVEKALTSSGPVPSVRDMLSLQMNLSKLTFEYELVSKVVSRSTQNIDQLVKLQ